MKLGITPWRPREQTAAGLTAQAVEAERLGYDSFWLPESHFGDNAIPEPLMLLAAVAAGTSRIRLATTSYLLPMRNPLQAAEQVAVLDQLSAGRVTLGVGRGYAPRMLRAFDVDPRHKRSLFEACLRQMLLAWSGASLCADGADGEALTLCPLPVQRPHPPIWVAAFGPKALQQAGTLGLPYLASPVEPLDVLERNYHAHRQAALAARVDVPEQVPVMRLLFVAQNDKETQRMRGVVHEQALRRGRLPADATAEDWSIVGERAYVAERIAEYVERLGMTQLIAARPRGLELEDRRITRSMVELADIAAAAAND